MNNFPSKAEILRLRAQYPSGARVELTAPMNDLYTKLNAGERATVLGVDDIGNIICLWDCGSRLNLIPIVDELVLKNELCKCV